MKRCFLIDGSQVGAVSIRCNGRKPNDASEAMDTGSFKEADQTLQVDVTNPRWLVAQQHGSGDASGVNDFGNAVTFDNIMPSIMVRQIVFNNRERGSLWRHHVARNKTPPCESKPARDGPTNQSAYTCYKNHFITHSAASAKRTRGRTELKIRRSSTLSPILILRIAPARSSIGKVPF